MADNQLLSEKLATCVLMINIAIGNWKVKNKQNRNYCQR